MDYRYFTPDEFVADDYFRQWVKQPNESSTLFWHTFLAEHPEQTEAVRLAAEAVINLSAATAGLVALPDGEEEAAIWRAIQARASSVDAPSPFLTKHWGTGWRWFLAAASVMIIVWLGWWTQRNQLIQNPEHISVEKTNNNDKPFLVSLPDGSSVILQKGSQLRFPKQFSAGKRVVHLTGEAFFEVAKDPNNPFFVYANELVTKVLGTSFNIRAYADDKDVVVTVRSGRVSVFHKSDEKQQQEINASTLDGLVITPNQQLVFVRNNRQLPKPEAVSPTIASRVVAFDTTSFQFNATPISEVFNQLEKVYGISVSYNKETLGKCRLTADLTDETLANKMIIICKSIEASYTITNTQLAVSGPGCGF
ncbi:FecR domain-containing protein [Fibrella aquatica]|uniref:FecR domain-containing protein n=1 Tax=Fibrella aquatica TaxID=3242487 RepID=UPI00352097CF